LMTSNTLDGIWQWEATSVSTGDWQYLQTDILQRTMTKEKYGYVRLLCCCGTLLMKCGSIGTRCYMIRTSWPLEQCAKLKSTMRSQSCLYNKVDTYSAVTFTKTMAHECTNSGEQVCWPRLNRSDDDEPVLCSYSIHSDSSKCVSRKDRICSRIHSDKPTESMGSP
jgi:hypothetical protein